jgi:hypothetical protein
MYWTINEESYQEHSGNSLPAMIVFFKGNTCHSLCVVQPCIMRKMWTGASGNGHKSFLSSQESFLRGGTVSMYRFAI